MTHYKSIMCGVVVTSFLLILFPCQSLAQTWPTYDPYAEGNFQVFINDIHWTETGDTWAPIPYVPVDTPGRDGSPDPDETWWFYIVASDNMVDGGGQMTFDWDADASYAQSAVVWRSRSRGYEHREEGNLTNGRVTIITCVAQADGLLELEDPDCGGAVEAACQFQCPQLEFLRTGRINFGRSTSATSIGQASYQIGPLSVGLNFQGSLGAGEYLDSDGETGGPATGLMCMVELTQRVRGRIELWASDSAFSGAAIYARLKGYVRSTTELSHD